MTYAFLAVKTAGSDSFATSEPTRETANDTKNTVGAQLQIRIQGGRRAHENARLSARELGSFWI